MFLERSGFHAVTNRVLLDHEFDVRAEDREDRVIVAECKEYYQSRYGYTCADREANCGARSSGMEEGAIYLIDEVLPTYDPSLDLTPCLRELRGLLYPYARPGGDWDCLRPFVVVP